MNNNNNNNYQSYPNQGAYQNPSNYYNSNNLQNNGYAQQPHQNQFEPLLNQNNFNDDIFEERLAAQGAGMRHSEIGNQRRELQFKKQIDGIIGEMVYSMCIVFSIATFVIANHSQNCDAPLKMWLAVVMGNYLGDFILAMTQYHFLQKNRKENLVVMALRYLLLCFLSGWLAYGNVVYYKQAQEETCSNSLRIITFLILLIGYFEMLKCCCFSMIVCIMIPFVFYAARRAQRPNWIPAAPQFVQNLMKTKFNPEENKAFDQCAICLLDFQPNDEITPLPCDEKHYFHPECIKDWLKTNNICPLCKKPITKEALNEQKKKFQSKDKEKK